LWSTYRRAAATPRLPARKQSEAERYDIKQLILSRFTNADQPQEGIPFLLRMSGHHLRSVRSSSYLGEVRAYAKLSLSLTKRGEDRAANGTKRSPRSGTE